MPYEIGRPNCTVFQYNDSLLIIWIRMPYEIKNFYWAWLAWLGIVRRKLRVCNNMVEIDIKIHFRLKNVFDDKIHIGLYRFLGPNSLISKCIMTISKTLKQVVYDFFGHERDNIGI